MVEFRLRSSTLRFLVFLIMMWVRYFFPNDTIVIRNIRMPNLAVVLIMMRVRFSPNNTNVTNDIKEIIVSDRDCVVP